MNGKKMTTIEKIAGDSLENLLEQEWPSPQSADAFMWPRKIAMRGSVRLVAERVRGSEDIRRQLLKVGDHVLNAL